MMRHLVTAVLALILAAPAPPAGALTQLERSVQTILREYGFRDVDVERLTPAQLAAIHHTGHVQDRRGGTRGEIKSILGGRNTLRGLFGGN